MKFNWQENKPLDIKDVAGLDKAIKQQIGFYAKSKARLHVILCACLQHMAAHNDASRLNHLFNELPVTVNKMGISVWLQAYTSLEFKKNKEGKVMWLGKDKNYLFKAEALDMPFYEMERNKKAIVPMTIEQKLLAVLTFGTNAVTKKNNHVSDYDKGLLAQITKAYKAYSENNKEAPANA
jgi:hypothetical protein